MFTAAASGAEPTGFGTVASTPSATTGSGFGFPRVGAAAQPEAPSGKTANPFMGLSLFSPPPSSGSLFTTAATSLQRMTSTASSAAQSTGTVAGEDTQEDDEEGGPDEEEEQEPEEILQQDGPTGEEEEEVVFKAESCKLWKLVRQDVGGEQAPTLAGAGSASKENGWRWQERGLGTVHINRHKKTGAGRLVMRMRGVLKLLLNTPVFPTTKYEKVGNRSVCFVGVDVEGSTQADQVVTLSAFRISLGSSDLQGRFLAMMKDLQKPQQGMALKESNKQ